MRDVTELVRLMKKSALDAVKASNPLEVRYGKVVNTSPLQIQIDQKIVLTNSHLILTRNVTDYELEVTVDMFTENSDAHTHKIEGKKKIIVHNALKSGENVLLLREQGGKKYIVVDRV